MERPGTTPLPIPGDVLERMREVLSPRYGSEVWTGDGLHILVVRTPGDDPDVVNDVEGAIEHLQPGEVSKADRCLLLGNRRSVAVSTGPLKDLMQQRVVMDKDIVTKMRASMQGRSGHVLVRSPGTNSSMRLGIRIPKQNARDIDDDDLDSVVDILGPRLDGDLKEVSAVYVLADDDDVRLDADLIMPGLRERFADESRHEQKALEEARRLREEEAKRQAEREGFLAELKAKYPGVYNAGSASTAPEITQKDMWQRPGGSWPGEDSLNPEERTGSRTVGPSAIERAVDAISAPRRFSSPSQQSGNRFAESASDEGYVDLSEDDAFRRRLDGKLAGVTGHEPLYGDATQNERRDDAYISSGSSGPGSENREETEEWSYETTKTGGAGFDSTSDSPVTATLQEVEGMAGRAMGTPALSSDLASAAATLRAAGYEVLENPEVAGHRIDLAAERDESPSRVVVRSGRVLDVDAAESFVKTCSEIDTDLGLFVAPEADADAEERLIATRAKWVTREALEEMAL